MEPQTFDFKPDTPKLSKEMQATLAKTEAALKQMWEREKREAQTLTIFGKEHAEHILRTLKGLKLTGTYRITKK